jgi:hypothetical protein
MTPDQSLPGPEITRVQKALSYRDAYLVRFRLEGLSTSTVSFVFEPESEVSR